MRNNNDIGKIKSELENITIVSGLNYYDNPCLVSLDAVMSLSRVYEKTVVAKINYFQKIIQILTHLKNY